MTYHARVTESGELILTADIARALGFRPGDAITLEGDVATDGVKLVAADGHVVQDNVDRFIAERAGDWDD